MTPEEAKQHIEHIRRDKFGISPDGTKQPNALERDLRAALKNLSEELNAKETHFILELLQNAEDNTYPGGVEPELCISVEDNDPTETGGDGCLYLLNNEVGFTPEQVWSLCSVGQSTKDKARGYIGEKGIGFKSVFRVSDQPHIFSNGYQFCFQKPKGLDELGYIVPRWVDFVPDAVRPGFTGIFLPLSAGKRSGIAEKLQAVPPETILFLTQLRRLGIGQGHFVARDKTLGVVKLSADAAESLYFVHRETWPKPNDLVEDKRVGINEREVTVALPLKSTRTCNGRVFAFLPTELDTGLPFLVNADFLLSASRDSLLDDRRWNQWLRDEIVPTFVKAFLSLVRDPEWKTDAYRFLPLLPDLMSSAEFFGPIIVPIQKRLRAESCILTESGSYALPTKTYFADTLSRQILSDAPAKLENFQLVHPALEKYRVRLKPLEVQALTVRQILDICNDADWLRDRKHEWWETLFDLLSQNDIKAEDVSEFPIFRCRDGVCRRPVDGVFHHADSQPTPTSLPAEWPQAHLFDAELQTRLQQKPKVWAWLTGTAGLRTFSIQSYITDKLLSWMRRQTGRQLVDATRFIATNLRHFDAQSGPAWRQRLRINQASQSACEKIPWLLADGRVILPEQRGGKQLVAPECLEGGSGWNFLFCALDRHFFVLKNDYCDGLSAEALSEMQELFRKCDVTAFPNPQLRELDAHDANYEQVFSRCARHIAYGTPRLRDWAAPGWLLGLGNVEQTVNGPNKVAALGRWLKERESAVEGFLHCSAKQDYEDDWQPLVAWSELGDALRDRAWLYTSKGYVKPPTAFLDTPEFREFFGDSVAYVAIDIASPLLEKLGVRVRLTAEVLIGRLREMSVSENPDFGLLTKIYRRLQDSNFDPGIFRREKLIFLSEPNSRWLPVDKLVWEDADALFDDDFGYVELTYGERDKSELRRLFNEHLKVPARPELKQYASAWKSLCDAPPTEPAVTEKKLRIVLQRLAENQEALPTCDWWSDSKPHLCIWDGKRFAPPAEVYVPDDFVAVELFTGLIPIAFPPKPNPAMLGFLRWMGCPSLASNIQPKLAGTSGESSHVTPTHLTPAAKELCVLLVCSHHGWQERASRLEALLKTEEIAVSTLTVEYSLRDNPNIGAQSRVCDAHWDLADRRLLLREGVDQESLRDAAAKNIAATFFGETESAEMQAEFFRLLTVSGERAQKLMDVRSTWRLNPDQQKWLRGLNWQTVIIKLDAVEQTPAPRAPRAATSPPPAETTITPPVAANSQTNITNAETAAAQGKGTAANQTAPTAPGQRNQETPRSEMAKTNQDHEPQTQAANEAPSELHDASTTTADFVPVRAHTRSSPQRSRGEQTNENQRGATSGLTTVSAESKKTLEERGREFAANKLREKEMGYEVEVMGQHNPGFDLRAVKPGDTLKVEVKSHAREASSVFVSQREYEEYLKTLGVNGETWELWNVENLAKSSGKSPTIQRVGHIPESAMKESGYWVDLSQCSQEPPTSGTADSQ